MKKSKMLLILLLIFLSIFLAGCCMEPGWRLVKTEQVGGETYTIQIVTSPLGARVTIDKKYKGMTPLKVSYTAPQYKKETWHYMVTDLVLAIPMGCTKGAEKVEYIGEPQLYSEFIQQDKVLSIQKENYEDVVIVFNMENARRRIAEVIELVRKERALSPQDSKEEQQIPPQQQQQMMGPTIIIGGKTVTGDEAVKIVNYGLVMFDSMPQGAEVLIEENLIGYTPTDYLKFEVGTYNVEIIKTGYKSWERKIMVIQDSSIKISPDLEKG